MVGLGMRREAQTRIFLVICCWGLDFISGDGTSSLSPNELAFRLREDHQFNSVFDDYFNVPEIIKDLPLRNQTLSRRRRFLSIKSTALVAATFSMPGDYLFGIPATVALTSKVNLNFPTYLSWGNLADILNLGTISAGRGITGYNRTFFFDQVEHFLESVGYDGRICLQLLVCELAELPFNHGLMGEIVNFLFGATTSPNEHRDETLIIPSIYKKAKDLGQNHGNCLDAFPRCSRSIINFFSLISSF